MMSTLTKILSIVWLCIAIIFEFISTIGGDTSILSGWLLLIWTAPFSIVFRFYLYDWVLQFMTKPTAQFFGSVFEVVGSYLFWFVFIPKIWPKRQR